MDAGDRERELEARVGRLERMVERLTRELRERGPALDPGARRPRANVAPKSVAAKTGPAKTGPATAGPAKTGPANRTAGAESSRPVRGPVVDWTLDGERWLGRVGVAFVLLALGFLFKYSYDQGWITPTLRLVFGLTLGTAMLVAGLVLESVHRRLPEMLLGGAVAVYYMVGFAAYQLYGLVPYVPAFSWMATVTVLALVLADRQDRPTLAVLGAAGGLATPFLLFTGTAGVPALVAYTSLILLGAGAVYVHRGWPALLAVLVLGGTAALAFAAHHADGGAGWSLLLGIVALWSVGGAAPLVRLQDDPDEAEPGRDDRPYTGAGPVPAYRPLGVPDPAVVPTCAALATVLAVPVLVFLAWDPGRGVLGLILVGFATLYAAVAAAAGVGSGLRRPAALVASAALPAGTLLGVAGDAAFLLLAAEAAGLLFLAPAARLPGPGAVGRAAAVLCATWFVVTALGSVLTPEPFFDPAARYRLGALALLFAGTLALDEDRAAASQVACYAGLLLWLLVELGPLDRGAALVSLSWGVLGLGLFVAWLGGGTAGLQKLGLGTLGLVAAKLLLVDMAQLDVLWRIALFLGFGTTFLLLGWAIRRPGDEGESDRPPSAARQRTPAA